ncbi:MAG: hypothetical protein IJ051_00795 [Clostridia bacterium]|nr:hypothetical protein [Clostridia bacterium]
MDKKGRKNGFFGRLFAGPDESARKPSSRARSGEDAALDVDEIETPEDILAKYGKYLDEDGVPFKGINPKPKYYVVPKEVPPEETLDGPPVRRPDIVHQIKTTPTPPKPKKAAVKKVRKPEPTPRKVVVKKRARPAPEPAPAPAPKKVVVKKRPAPVETPPETKTKTVTVKVKSKS